ncbi:MAG: hypothetical protein H0U74_21085 [Bradymonadaceae bacterium]|nr:hypothetical protein [Lujinxingiaceae bacterium]
MSLAVGVMGFLGCASAAPAGGDDENVVETATTSETLAEAAPIRTEPELWTYKHSDLWSQVLTSSKRDVRGSESENSNCQGSVDVVQIGSCFRWELTVPCETEGEKLLHAFSKSRPRDGEVCRDQDGAWTLRDTPDGGSCSAAVSEQESGLVSALVVHCEWMSQDRLRTGKSEFAFAP